MTDEQEEARFDPDDARFKWVEKHVEPAFKHVPMDKFRFRFDDETFLCVSLLDITISCQLYMLIST